MLEIKSKKKKKIQSKAKQTMVASIYTGGSRICIHANKIM